MVKDRFNLKNLNIVQLFWLHTKIQKFKIQFEKFNWCNILPFVGCYNEITLFIPFNSELFILVAFLLFVQMNIDNVVRYLWGWLYARRSFILHIIPNSIESSKIILNSEHRLYAFRLVDGNFLCVVQFESSLVYFFLSPLLYIRFLWIEVNTKKLR